MLLKIVAGLWLAVASAAIHPVYVLSMIAALFYRHRVPIGPPPVPGGWRDAIEQAVVEIFFILLGLAVACFLLYVGYLTLTA